MSEYPWMTQLHWSSVSHPWIPHIYTHQTLMSEYPWMTQLHWSSVSHPWMPHIYTSPDPYVRVSIDDTVTLVIR